MKDIYVKFSDLKGKVLKEVTISPDKDEVLFVTDNDEKYSLAHGQDCCEVVRVEEVVGDLAFLLNTPILVAVEASNEGDRDRGEAGCSWTFYNLGTIKGYVTIRWCGESNGYYSESVDFGRVE